MKRFIAVILLVAMTVAVIPAAQADLMTEARSMLQLINEFRTGDDAWYWNSDNRTVTKKTGLGRLQYDEELEAVALVRAKELAVLFDHTRPDGTSCFTAFPAGIGRQRPLLRASWKKTRTMTDRGTAASCLWAR